MSLPLGQYQLITGHNGAVERNGGKESFFHLRLGGNMLIFGFVSNLRVGLGKHLLSGKSTKLISEAQRNRCKITVDGVIKQ